MLGGPKEIAMRALVVLIPLILAGAAAGAAAEPAETTQCIEVSGRQVPAVCKVAGGRLDLR